LKVETDNVNKNYDMWDILKELDWDDDLTTKSSKK
jgi:hypothetical protein